MSPRALAETDLHPGLGLAVYAAAIPDGTPCWTFVTRGLSLRQHPELVLSIVMREGDAAERYPAEAVELLRGLTRGIPFDVRFDPWESVTLPGGALGRAELTGLVAVPAAGPDGLPLPDHAVALLALTREETEIAQDHGSARVAAMLGYRYRYYPTAWWVDRDRASLLTRAQLATSHLHGKAGRRLPGLTTVFESGAVEISKRSEPRGLPEGTAEVAGKTLRVRVEPAARAALIEWLRTMQVESARIALLQPDRLAGGRFAWVPGAEAPTVITGPGFTGRVTGSFLVLGLHPPGSQALLVEDGAVLALTPADRDAVVAALEGGRAYGSTTGSDHGVRWVVESVEAARPDAPGPIGTDTLAGVALLTPEAQLAERVSAPDLAAFVSAIALETKAAVRAVAPGAATVRVHLTLRPGSRAVRLEPRPDVRGAWVDDLRRRIDALPVVVVTGEVQLYVDLAVRAEPGAQAP